MRRKRSRNIALVAMGTSLLALTACDQKPQQTEAAVFETPEQCMEMRDFDTNDCEDKFYQARQMHQKVAPRYDTIADCEADFGAHQCEPTGAHVRQGHSIYIPLMAGYLMGRIAGGRTGPSQPLYRSADDRSAFRTADNRRIGSSTGLVRVAGRTISAPSAKTQTIKRGGFGASARASAAG
jgi:uncharacterized protein YgiB involved in biofilm formation